MNLAQTSLVALQFIYTSANQHECVIPLTEIKKNSGYLNDQQMRYTSPLLDASSNVYAARYETGFIFSSCKDTLGISKYSEMSKRRKTYLSSLKLNLFLFKKVTHFKELGGFNECGQNKMFPILSSQVVMPHRHLTEYSQ